MTISVVVPCFNEEESIPLFYREIDVYKRQPYVIGDGYAHVALSTPDLEGLNAEHKAKGYEVTEPKGLPGTQPNYYFVVDPDGYKVEVLSLIHISI